MFVREEHRNLRGGTGIVITYTWRFGRYKFTILELDSNATIGMHTHICDSEMYITFDKNIRFCGNKKWRCINYCRSGGGKMHSAENISKMECAKLFAIKKF